MRRRSVLKAAAALALGPAWLREAFADEQCSPGVKAGAPGNATAALSSAYRAAQRGGRPLLVFVVPENKAQRWDRGTAFGEWLNHGSAEQLRPLALVEVACGRMAVLRKLVPSVPSGEPVMVLVDTEQSPAVVRFLEGVVPKLPLWVEDRVSDEAIDKRIEALSELLRAGTVGDTAATARRLAQNNAALTAAERARLGGDVTSMELALVERAAPTLMAQSKGVPAREAEVLARLDALVSEKVKKKPPRGTRWANSTGCGAEIEGDTDDRSRSVDCGMGHTPQRSRRFLLFFTGSAFEDKPDDE